MTYHEQFITKSMKFILLDTSGDIRGAAYTLEEIVKLKLKYRWGTIHRMNFRGNKLEIGEEIKG